MKTLRNKKGTTLIEVLFAFLIVAIMSTVMATAILSTTRDVNKGEALAQEFNDGLALVEDELYNGIGPSSCQETSLTLTSENGLSTTLNDCRIYINDTYDIIYFVR